MSNFLCNLFQWYRKNHRKLSFRETKDPYCIWISETMLQQTRVNAMLSSYNSFIQRFPNVQTLANATQEEVIKYWKGLGYYSRAINLHKASIYLVQEHNSQFPADLKSMLKIPGIGPYTARAILSIAWDQSFAVLDGNVKRVLSRIKGYTKNIRLANSAKELQEIADSMVPLENAGDYNQALMELGATICTPNPDCLLCPIKNDCYAYQNNQQSKIPFMSKPEPKIELILDFYLIFNKEKSILLLKDNKRRFLKSIYSLPFTIYSKDIEYYDIEPKFKKFLLKSNNFLFQATKKHTITNHNITVKLRSLDNNQKIELPDDLELKWISINNLVDEFPSSIAKKIQAIIQK